MYLLHRTATVIIGLCFLFYHVDGE